MDTVKMSTVAIQSGAFSKKGNFSGYNASGVRIHVSANNMKTLGFDSTNATTITYPLYACVVEREFNVVDENDKPVKDDDGEPKTFTRLQAGSIFKTKAELINAVNADKLLAVEAESELQKVAKSLNLTAEALVSLSNAI